MSYKKFNKQDIIYNTIKAFPSYNFKIYNGKAFINNNDSNIYLNSLLTQEVSFVSACALQLDFSCEDNSQYIGIF